MSKRNIVKVRWFYLTLGLPASIFLCTWYVAYRWSLRHGDTVMTVGRPRANAITEVMTRVRGEMWGTEAAPFASPFHRRTRQASPVGGERLRRRWRLLARGCCCHANKQRDGKLGLVVPFMGFTWQKAQSTTSFRFFYRSSSPLGQPSNGQKWSGREIWRPKLLSAWEGSLLARFYCPKLC